jgi:hypothetical protein
MTPVGIKVTRNPSQREEDGISPITWTGRRLFIQGRLFRLAQARATAMGKPAMARVQANRSLWLALWIFSLLSVLIASLHFLCSLRMKQA